ncbi:hypothetical protein [Dokdonella fugitiva]|jgi:hypothetical protein|uniref:WD40 repeat protein n=1 Tax=Dokdonella fugitiva TaxID=328517 RepID=A0A4R2IB10_9GAMM|nr:hypothetical protein [Dokdonella fugitiva]TCO41286.1 hypothetical protein EV148_103206 [Dokdonella fugitiva]
MTDDRSAAHHPPRARARLALVVATLAAVADAGAQEGHSQRELPPLVVSRSTGTAREGVAAACASEVYADQPPALRSLQPQGSDPPQPVPPKPAKGAVFRDRAGTCVVRATAHDAEPPPTFARNDYARRQPFNADSSYVLVYASGGYWHLYDARTLRYLKRLDGPAGDAEPQWHPTDPNTLYYLPTNGGLVLHALDVRDNQSRVAADFSGRLPWPDATHLWTKDEGSPSADGRWWGFQAEAGNDFAIRGYVVYDLATDRIVGTRAATIRPDHVSMSPSGRWFTSSGDEEGTWAWSPDFRSKKKLHHKSEHSDLAIGANGHDLYVSIDFQSARGDVFFVDIDACPSVPASKPAASVPECPRTVLFPTYLDGAHASLHFSGKAFANPGWVVVSSYDTQPMRSGGWPWYTNKIFAVELAAHPRMRTLGYHEVTRYAGYWTEPHASPNRTLDRVMFNSNWGTASADDVDDYMIVLRERALPLAARGAATPAPPAQGR